MTNGVVLDIHLIIMDVDSIYIWKKNKRKVYAVLVTYSIVCSVRFFNRFIALHRMIDSKSHLYISIKQILIEIKQILSNSTRPINYQ